MNLALWITLIGGVAYILCKALTDMGKGQSVIDCLGELGRISFAVGLLAYLLGK